MVKRLHRRCRDERGVVLALVAIMMVVFLGMAALAIDVGYFYQQQRQAQNAADAAALAGSHDTQSTPTVTTDVNNYVAANMPGATNVITYPSASQIKVVVSKTVPAFFGHIFGIGSANVSASAVAGLTKTGAGAAPVFAYDSNCDGALTLNGTTNIPEGVTVNGDIVQNGNYDTFGASTAGCPYHQNGTGNTYGGTSSPASGSTSNPWPLDYRTSPPTCTQTDNVNGFTFQTTGATIPAGVYCTTQSINITANNLTGNVTFVASSFQLNGQSESFTPYSGNLLIWDKGSGGLNVNVNSSANFLEGATIFAPTDSVNVNGGSGTFSGFIEANKVTISGGSQGSPFILNGTGPGPGGEGLVQ